MYGDRVSRMSVEDRRAQLVEAAITVMTREGVRKATTRAIVGEAGASLSVFHYCFDSKAALFEEVVRTIVGRSAGLAKEALTGVATDDDALMAGLLAYWEHVVANPEQHLLTYEVTQHCLRIPELHDVARSQYDLYANVIAIHLRGSLEGEPDDATVACVARYLAVIIDGVTLNWLARRDDDEALAVLRSSVPHVKAMWAAGLS